MTVDAVRFYEKRGLLPRAQRSAGHFRLYGPRDLERVRFIRQMQALGFSLREIRELVELRGRKTEACETVRFTQVQRGNEAQAKTQTLSLPGT